MEELYKYEVHCHTCESSRCAKMTAEQAVNHFKKLNYTGVFITNHLVPYYPTDCSWEEKVDFLCKGYEIAKKVGNEIGLDVFFAWEMGRTWEHFLTYGLDKEWLLNHPDFWDWDEIEYLENVHKDGGFVVHAHPFRDGVSQVILHPDLIDAVEILNTSHTPESNRRAECYANMLSLPMTAGSDIHKTSQEVYGGIYTNQKIVCPTDYPEILKNGNYKIFGENYGEGIL